MPLNLSVHINKLKIMNTFNTLPNENSHTENNMSQLEKTLVHSRT